MVTRHVYPSGMKVWHIHVNNSSRAFANPQGVKQRLILLIRGWRPFNHLWWSKSGKKLPSLNTKQ